MGEQETVESLATEARLLGQRLSEISNNLSKRGVSTEMHVRRLHTEGQEIQTDELWVRVNAPVGVWGDPE